MPIRKRTVSSNPGSWGPLTIFLLFSLLTFLSGCGGGDSRGSARGNQSTVIAFVSGRALDGSNTAGNTVNIWTVKPDGSKSTALTKLTTSLALCFNPIWAPNGGKIAFVSGRALDGSDAANIHSTENIWVMNADGSNATPLTRVTASNADGDVPVWSPDGSKIAFVSSRALNGSDAANANSTKNIWVINADGFNPVPLTTMTATNADSLGPVWSPDGRKLVFSSSRDLNGMDATNGVANIWVMDADGFNAMPLTKTTAANGDSFFPSWSSNGTKLVFVSRRALNGSDAANANATDNIWVMNADGSNMAPLTRTTATNSGSFFPAWSPDGSRLVFASSRSLHGTDAANGAANIWTMNADGSNTAPLTKTTAVNSDSFFPVWSPDGSKIAFESYRSLDGSDAGSTIQNVWVMGSDGSGVTPLTKLTAANADSFSPRWRP